MRSFSVFALIIPVAGALATVAGSQPAAAPHPAVAAGGPAAAPSAEDAQAQTVLTNVCTSCHDLSVLTARPHRADEWPTILHQMVANGANLSDDDFKIMQSYLARTYSAPAS